MRGVLCSTLLVVVAFILINAEERKGEWPKKKVTYSDSFLPAVIQVLTYLLTRIDRVPSTPADSISIEGSVIGIIGQAAPAPSSSTTEPPEMVDTTESTTVEYQPEVSTEDDGMSTPPTEKLRDFAEMIERIEGNFEKTEQELVQVLRPTIAEIMLNKLRDVLANEAKRRGFSKLQGYSDTVLQVLAESSNGSSEEQLETLLKLLLRNNDLKRRTSISQVTHLLDRLSYPEGPLQKALANIPPMIFSV